MHYYHFSLIQCIQFCISLTDDFCRADSGFHRVTLLTFSRALCDEIKAPISRIQKNARAFIALPLFLLRFFESVDQRNH